MDAGMDAGMDKARGQEPERRADEPDEPEEAGRANEAGRADEVPVAEAFESPQPTTEGFSPNSTMEGRGGRPEDLSPDDFE